MISLKDATVDVDIQIEMACKFVIEQLRVLTKAVEQANLGVVVGMVARKAISAMSKRAITGIPAIPFGRCRVLSFKFTQNRIRQGVIESAISGIILTATTWDYLAWCGSNGLCEQFIAKEVIEMVFMAGVTKDFAGRIPTLGLIVDGSW